MRLTRGKRKTNARQSEEVILFMVNEQCFAIAANAVDEIRNLEGLSSPPTTGFLQSRLAKVKYTLIREKKDPDKVFFVVDAAVHFGIKGSAVSRILVLRDSSTAVMVEGIDRIAQITTIVGLPQSFSGMERVWYRGLALLGDQVIPVVNAEAFLNKGEQAVLHAGYRNFLASDATKGEVPA